MLWVQFLVVLPFVPYMPLMIPAVFILVVLWRWQVLRGNVRKPPKAVIYTAVGTGVVGLMLSGLSNYSLDTAVAFCLLGYLLKSLEVLRRRDAIFQIYLGLFLTGVYLLYRFDVLGGLLLILLLSANFIALYAVTAESHFSWGSGFKYTGAAVLAAIPLMIVGYMLFPRLPPLWTIPNDQRGGVTGMSDELEFGAVSSLAQSSEPAFRVAFEGDLPPRNQWYWRGTTLSEFDGRRWRSRYSANGFFGWPRGAELPSASEADYQYTVIMEKTGQRWLYFLDWPISVAGENIRIIPDGRAAIDRPMSGLYRYQASSAFNVSWSNQADEVSRALALPRTGNLELRRWAQEQRSQFASAEDFVEFLQQTIRTQPFVYTLQPPVYDGPDGVERFWFGDRRGFCEHYAGAAAVILRAAGIPARLVGGYLGGNYQSGGNYIQVRQMEAHAWVEYFNGAKWVRFDPTAAVAPERIETNLDDWLSASEPSQLPLGARLNQVSFVNQWLMRWDMLQYQWQVRVLDYNQQATWAQLDKALNGVTPMKVLMLVFVIMAAVVIVVGVTTGMIRLPKRVSEPQRSLQQLYRQFGERQPNETLRQYLNRLAVDYPNQVDWQRLGHLFEQAFYQPSAQASTALPQFMKQIKRQRR